MSSATSSATPFDVEATERKLAERCREAVRLALAAGAQEAEAYATRGRETTVGMEKGDLQLARSSSSGALGLRDLIADEGLLRVGIRSPHYTQFLMPFNGGAGCHVHCADPRRFSCGGISNAPRAA